MKRTLAHLVLALTSAFALSAPAVAAPAIFAERSLTLPTPAQSIYVDAQRAVVASPDNGTITLIPRTGTPRTVRATTRFYDTHVTPQGRVLATELDRRLCGVRLWDVSAGRVISSLVGDFRQMLGCADPIGFLFSSAFSQGGQLLYTADSTGLRRWDVASGKLLGAVRGEFRHVSLAADRVVVLGTGGLQVWTPDLGRRLAQSGNLGRLCVTSPYSGVTVGGLLAAYSCRDGVRVWNTDTGKRTLLPRPKTEHGWDDGPSFSFSPDARLVAADEDSLGVTVWDLRSGKRLAQIGVPAGVQVTDIKFTARRMVVALSDGRVQFYDLTAGLRALPTRQVLTFPGQHNVHVTLAVSADGRQLLVCAGTPAGQVRVLPLP